MSSYLCDRQIIILKKNLSSFTCFKTDSEYNDNYYAKLVLLIVVCVTETVDPVENVEITHLLPIHVCTKLLNDSLMV